MDFEYSSVDELFELIRQINTKYYERLNANILYLEELADKIYVVYIIELRDAYSHLVRIFDDDILSPEGRRNVQQHLLGYSDHLQRGLLDTFRKILALEFKSLLKSVHRKNVSAIELQVAKKASELRVMDKQHSVDERIDGYVQLMNYISETREKLSIPVR